MAIEEGLGRSKPAAPEMPRHLNCRTYKYGGQREGWGVVGQHWQSDGHCATRPEPAPDCWSWGGQAAVRPQDTVDRPACVCIALYTGFTLKLIILPGILEMQAFAEYELLEVLDHCCAEHAELLAVFLAACWRKDVPQPGQGAAVSETPPPALDCLLHPAVLQPPPFLVGA